jgi:hypothetical protein
VLRTVGERVSKGKEKIGHSMKKQKKDRRGEREGGRQVGRGRDRQRGTKIN